MPLCLGQQLSLIFAVAFVIFVGGVFSCIQPFNQKQLNDEIKSKNRFLNVLRAN